ATMPSTIPVMVMSHCANVEPLRRTHGEMMVKMPTAKLTHGTRFESSVLEKSFIFWNVASGSIIKGGPQRVIDPGRRRRTTQVDDNRGKRVSPSSEDEA